MFTTINEPISVLGIYHHQTFTPRKFKWRNQEYDIQQITLRSDVKDGGIRQRLYSVMAHSNASQHHSNASQRQLSGTLYRLAFNREQETWNLEEVWCE